MPRLDLDRLVPSTERATRLRGVYLGIVTSNTESGGDSRYRVKLRFPWLPDGDESHWARILVPMAGQSRGTYFLPEVDDQVLVVFEHGDVSRPIVIGGLWSTVQKPPQRNDDGKNNIKVIKSRSGHRLIFDDTEGRERLIVVDSTGRNRIVLDSAGDALTIQSAGDIELLAPSGAVKVHGQTVKLTAGGQMGGTGAQVAVSATSMNVAATGLLELKGGSVMLNPGGGAVGTLAPGGAAAGAATAGQAMDQIREQARSAAAEVAVTAMAASAAAREAAALLHLPDTRSEPPRAVVGAEAGAGEVQPGKPVPVSATVDGTSEARYELVDADTGEVIDEGPATVSGGKATANVPTDRLAGRPETSRVKVRVVSSGGATETAAMPVAGREPPLGARSPSSDLADPTRPMPAARGGDIAGGGGAAAVADHRAPVAAPTVDHRGRALDTPAGGAASVADHRGAASVADHRGAASVADHRGAASVADHRGAGPSSGDDLARSARGGDPRVGRAAVSAIEGDGAGAVEDVAGGQVGGAVRGDASAAAGGGAAGALAEGDVRGAAAASGHAGSRVAHMDSADDVQSEVEGRATAEGKERSGIAAGEREVGQARGRVEHERRHIEHQADVEGRAEAAVSAEKSKATSEVMRAEREVHHVEAQADVEARAEAEISTEKSKASSEVMRAEREARAPEHEARSVQYQAEQRAGEARDPEAAAERAAHRQTSRGRSEVSDVEGAARDAERAADDPGRAGKSRIRKLDED